ncbi:Thioredoxin 5 protein [Rutstroemia sp. NJR-2017a WRK4]|nr:Thioredoxin 5 protein [Rutstroemia sp. NJR-2017a WRK4]
MPLPFPQPTTTDPQTLSQTLPTNSKPQYLIFFASLVPPNNQSWCGDCRNAEQPLLKYLGGQVLEEERVRLVYVGDRERWRSTSPRNEWKDEPWGIEKLPTVVKVTKEGWEKLVEEDCYDEGKLRAFVEE